MASPARISVMSEALADQIAAGEVVERPAAVVKELVENAIDAGATRIDVELEGAGLRAIRVIDDGHGIDPADLTLALRRHATSKLRRAEELLEISTHGFRGEALASIAAVARVRLRSRPAGAPTGHELSASPAQAPDPGGPRPVGMPLGTQIEIEHLFASVPARRKFLRSEATEVGHCTEAVLRAALVHPEVHFTLRQEGRTLVDFARATVDGRLEAVLGRRGGGSVHCMAGVRDGVSVRAWFVDPALAGRSRTAAFVVVRRRVVRERSLQQIVRHAYGDRLPAGAYPVFCLFVEPPRGTVDVNVHPQKIEVRFGEPQRVYTAVRELLGEAMADAPWSAGAGAVGARRSDARDALAGDAPAPGAPAATYRLGTRAVADDYQHHKDDLKRDVDTLRRTLGHADARVHADDRAPELASSHAPVHDVGPELLACLSGHVAVFVHPDGESLLAVDLLELRAHLVYRRLASDLGGEGTPAQGLLAPVVVSCAPADVALCAAGAELLSSIGIELEPFGEDAVVVRAVPAGLRHCVDDADVGDLVVRVLPWLRMLASGESAGERDARRRMLEAIARTRGADPAPRLARRWVRELWEQGALESAPGVQRWSAARLVELARE